MKTILLVSPSSSFLARNRNLLNSTGIRLVSATSAEEALQIHREVRADLLIAELNLPAREETIFARLFATMRNSKKFPSYSLATTPVPISGESPAAEPTPGSPSRSCRRAFWNHVRQLLTVSGRKHYRIPLRAEARALSADRPFSCTICNISTSGMLIETKERLHLNERISCTFSFSGSVRVMPRGETVRFTRLTGGLPRYGIRFIDLPADLHHDIETAIAAVEASMHGVSLRGRSTDYNSCLSSHWSTFFFSLLPPLPLKWYKK